jgi:hypothetical protein
LTEAEASSILDAGLPTRAALLRREVLGAVLASLGLVLVVAGSVGLGSLVSLAGIVLAVAGVVVFVVAQRKFSAILSVQVALYRRSSTERLAASATPGDVLPLEDDDPWEEPAIALDLRSVAAGDPTDFPGAPVAPPAKFTFATTLRVAGVLGSAGGAKGWCWDLRDSRGGIVMSFETDERTNRVYQMMENNPHLQRTYWLILDGQRRPVGRRVIETRTDDREGRGFVHIAVFDATGRERLAVRGAYLPIPRTVEAINRAYSDLSVYVEGSRTGPLFHTGPVTVPGALVLLDANGGTAATMNWRRPGVEGQWTIECPPGPEPLVALLAAATVAAWTPDGSTYRLARALATRPELARQVDAELRHAG